MTGMVSESKIRCLESRKLLAGSRYLIACSRRLLNRAFVISGGSSGDDLYTTVHDRLASGALFPAPQKVWAGHGTGRICIVCDAAITTSEVEHEIIDGPATVWTHSACYQIWRQESTSYQLANVMDGTNYLAGLRQIVRERFVRGTLFVLPNDKSWLGLGVSDICAVCNKPIFAAESSHEVTGLRRAHAHLVCYRAWLVESREERASAGSSLGGYVRGTGPRRR
jgi:hypothetical protein